jgi:hypothetical protein
MANTTDLEKALLTGVVDADLGLPIAQPNAAFDRPVDGSPWARAFVEMNQPSVATMSTAGEDGYTGYIQLDLNYPLHRGTADVIAKAAQVESFFWAGRKLTYAQAQATVSSCGRSRGREVDGWWRVTMTITWFARVKRN